MAVVKYVDQRTKVCDSCLLQLFQEDAQVGLGSLPDFLFALPNYILPWALAIS